MKIELHPAEHTLFLSLAQEAGLAQQKAQESMLRAKQFVAMLCEKSGVEMPSDANLHATKEGDKFFLQTPQPAPAPLPIPTRPVAAAVTVINEYPE